MGLVDEACELVGKYIKSELPHLFGDDVRFYRDEELTAIKATSREFENLKNSRVASLTILV